LGRNKTKGYWFTTKIKVDTNNIVKKQLILALVSGASQ